VVCLLAAASRPEGVRSLTVVEPPAFALARGNPAVEGVITGIERHYAHGQELSEEAFLEGFLHAWGFEEVAPRTLSRRARRGVRSSMTERFPWEAEIAVDPIAAAVVPALVVRGAWDEAEPGARELAGAAFAAVCAVLAARLHAQEAVFAGAAHQPQLLGAPFNDRIEAFWRSASEPA
jgi:pimeloyl-ACP methyl ester carboxylesterase